MLLLYYHEWPVLFFLSKFVAFFMMKNSFTHIEKFHRFKKKFNTIASIERH
ncbi:hypothetical protein SB6420_03704 [Klebsiella pasteurii]|nr:hypothetical protein SB6420_03704 [Klebsiella pasteurii]